MNKQIKPVYYIFAMTEWPGVRQVSPLSDYNQTASSRNQTFSIQKTKNSMFICKVYEVSVFSGESICPVVGQQNYNLFVI